MFDSSWYKVVWCSTQLYLNLLNRNIQTTENVSFLFLVSIFSLFLYVHHTGSHLPFSPAETLWTGVVIVNQVQNYVHVEECHNSLIHSRFIWEQSWQLRQIYSFRKAGECFLCWRYLINNREQKPTESLFESVVFCSLKAMELEQVCVNATGWRCQKLLQKWTVLQMCLHKNTSFARLKGWMEYSS